MKIKVSTTLGWPIERQVPSSWSEKGIEVVINQPVDRCDAWVVYQGLSRPESANVAPNRVFFFGYEPPGLHSYHPRFLMQFSSVVTCQNVEHPHRIHRHQAQPWLAGIKRDTTQNIHQGLGSLFTHNDFAEMVEPNKTNRLSVICSNKRMIPGHAERLSFLEQCKSKLGGELAQFGYGFKPLQDKWSALESYHYHLVVENCCINDYWTEKLADAYLAFCMPIVWGCTNLADYFPPESFIALDPENIQRSIEIIVQAVKSPPSDTQKLAIAEARRRILDTYNLFPEILRLVENTEPEASNLVRLKDERLFSKNGWLRPVVRMATDWWRRR